MSYGAIKTEVLEMAFGYAHSALETCTQEQQERVYTDLGMLAIELIARGRLVMVEVTE